MKLSEVLHMVRDDKQRGLVNLDDWKWADLDHLKSMGFEFDGDYTVSLQDPKIKIYKNKSPDGREVFVVDDKDKGKKTFNEFNDIIEFFDTYSQPDIDKERS
jgi:hypothetical protein